jgi:hypothetical protein
MESLSWTALESRQDLLLGAEAALHVAVAAGGGRLLAYLPENTTSVTLAAGVLGADATFRWHDVRTGEATPPMAVPGAVLVAAPPDARDWLLIASGAGVSVPNPPTPDRLTVYAAPNPSIGRTTLYVTAPGGSIVNIAVFDALGRRVHHGSFVASESAVVYPLELAAAGVYLCRVEAISATGARQTSTAKVLRLL